MAKLPTIMVSSFGRSGSSLLMQILSKAGIPTVGWYPDFEDEAALTVLPRWLSGQKGKAVKILDPQLALQANYSGDFIIFWLDREPEEQAKSTLKLLGFPPNRQAIRALVSSYKKDRPRALKALERLAGKVVRLDFEGLICKDRETIDKIRNALPPHFNVAPDIFDQVIVNRSTHCLPYLLEERLMSAHYHPSRKRDEDENSHVS